MGKKSLELFSFVAIGLLASIVTSAIDGDATTIDTICSDLNLFNDSSTNSSTQSSETLKEYINCTTNDLSSSNDSSTISSSESFKPSTDTVVSDVTSSSNSSSNSSTQLSKNSTLYVNCTEVPLQNQNNGTNGTADASVSYKALSALDALKIIPLSAIMLLVVFGNLLVILAVLTQRALRTPPNILILSLAIADLTVGVFILPLNVSDMVYQHWHYGKVLCRIWLTADVTLCSTSILHISAIAVDRYRSINEGISYISQRTVRTAISICICLWVIAWWIASAPVLGWNDWDGLNDTECRLPINWGFIVHSALGAFFLPGIVMVAVYIKIFFKIKQRFKERSKLSCVPTEPSRDSDSVEITDEEKRKTGKKYSTQITDLMKKKMKFSLTKERKAAQTLGIIIGAFVICWTPFTLTYLTFGFAPQHVNIHFFYFVTWLGYVNSALNPIIYTVYNQEFRRAFKRLLRLEDYTRWRTNSGV